MKNESALLVTPAWKRVRVLRHWIELAHQCRVSSRRLDALRNELALAESDAAVWVGGDR